jgi:hypothetical protein
MEELMNFGSFLAEEERSEIVSVVGWTLRAESSVRRVVVLRAGSQFASLSPFNSGGTDHIN